MPLLLKQQTTECNSSGVVCVLPGPRKVDSWKNLWNDNLLLRPTKSFSLPHCWPNHKFMTAVKSQAVSLIDPSMTPSYSGGNNLNILFHFLSWSQEPISLSSSFQLSCLLQQKTAHQVHFGSTKIIWNLSMLNFTEYLRATFYGLAYREIHHAEEKEWNIYIYIYINV